VAVGGAAGAPPPAAAADKQGGKGGAAAGAAGGGAASTGGGGGGAGGAGAYEGHYRVHAQNKVNYHRPYTLPYVPTLFLTRHLSPPLCVCALRAHR